MSELRSLRFRRVRHLLHYLNPLAWVVLLWGVLRIARLRFFYDWSAINRDRWSGFVHVPTASAIGPGKRIKIVADRCVGCGTCSTVCSLENVGEMNPSRARVQVVRDHYRGIDFPVVCQQCEHRPCTQVCPTGACSEQMVRHLPIPTIDQSKCIACRMCAMSCPYGAVVFDAVRMAASKCDLCAESDEPQCVRLCPTNALEWSDGRDVSVPGVFRTPEGDEIKMLVGG